MKFDITIKDATKEEAEKISALLFGVADSSFLVNVPPVQVSAPSTTVHVPTPDANTEETEQVNPAAVSTGEVDSRGFPWNEKSIQVVRKKMLTEPGQNAAVSKMMSSPQLKLN